MHQALDRIIRQAVHPGQQMGAVLNRRAAFQTVQQRLQAVGKLPGYVLAFKSRYPPPLTVVVGKINVPSAISAFFSVNGFGFGFINPHRLPRFCKKVSGGVKILQGRIGRLAVRPSPDIALLSTD
ncbi:MAG TPA: hypothetical protein P5175_08630 [Anaerohalosphaeraceae bacterium]|nr:hypothetical protein [Anaerohalosphaeraceae bacterium]